jgi:hypothetical protein
MRNPFEKYEDEYICFERVQNKRSNRPDLHAFLLLDELVPGKFDMISCAKHDEIYLEVNVEDLLDAATEEQLLELHRSGIRYDSETESLAMFV